MISLSAYQQSPCSALSIPYWKAKAVTVPDHMRIVHADDFDPGQWLEWTDTPYFRLYHDLKDIPLTVPEGYTVRTATRADGPVIVEIINRSYSDISVDLAQIARMTQTPAFCPDLWIIMLDKSTQKPVACGIADLDVEVGEGVLEWIQVLPEHRGRGIGKLVVRELLRRMQERARFATVSGQCDNPSNPEGLYRSCGFTGKDVWHILYKKSGEIIGKNP